jgi:predicted TIM-barrel fold metal-dependent hydrolase
MKSYVAFVRQLEMLEEHRRAILGENACRLFKLPLLAPPGASGG